jgi:hypothetical protein
VIDHEFEEAIAGGFHRLRMENMESEKPAGEERE